MLEWTALGGTAVLLVLAGLDFAHAREKPAPPVVVEVHAPPLPPNPEPWITGRAQAHALTITNDFAAWTEGDGSVRMAAVAPARELDITTFEHEFAIAGPVLSPTHEACWFTTRSELHCGRPGGQVASVARAPGSVVYMDADASRIVWTQFDGQVLEASRNSGEVRALAKLRAPAHVRLDGDSAYVVALEPLRVVRLGPGASPTVFERTGSVSNLGSLLADRDALYLDTRQGNDGLTSILRIAKADGAVTTLYQGFAHVALTAIHGETLYGLQAPHHIERTELDLEGATVVTLPTRGGALQQVREPVTVDRPSRDLVIGWGGSVAPADDGYLYFTHGPRNPVGAPGPIWRLHR